MGEGTDVDEWAGEEGEVCEGEVSVGGDGSEGMRENGKLDD
jgi:hypothetical protein